MKTVLQVQAGVAQRGGGAARGHQLEAQVGESLGHVHGFRLVVVVDADEDRALLGQRAAGADLRLQERFAEIDAHAHHFAGGAHLRARAPGPRRGIC